MPLRFKNRILAHLSHETYRPFRAKALAKELRVEADDRAIFNEALDALASDGEIEINQHGLIRLPKVGDSLTGRLKVNQRGFGFLIPDQAVREGDIFIPPGSLADAVSGDTVRVAIEQRGRRDRGGKPDPRKVGRVIEVIERGNEHFVGTLRQRRSLWVVVPDGRTLHDDVIIRDPHTKNAREGDKVVFEMVQYPSSRELGEGVITRVIGEAGRPDVETQAVIAAHGLRDGFPDDVIEQAREIARQFDEASTNWSDREDLTGVYTITIDPPDAKDFDDAITIDHDPKAKEWTLGVHIADVAHFVPRGSAMDLEAAMRGNSVYLPRLVLPMLPEVLSNGVCSLQEGVPRFVKSAFITLDDSGRVLGQRCCQSVIRSDKRLTYLEAQALIDGNEHEARKHARTEPIYTEELVTILRRADTLARILRRRRQRDGMISLNLPEVELIFDDDGHVVDAVPEDDAYTHTIIEMFMVEANEAVARLFEDLGVPLIRRVHPDPATGDMEMLRMYARVAGQTIPDEPTRRDMQRLLDATRDTPAARAIHFAVLRTLSKASYSPAMIGHYALASEHYTHFTSPIRRYPDLSVHRALEAYLDRTDNGRHVPGGRKRRDLGSAVASDDRALDEGELIQLGRHCSDTEIAAEEAERALRKFLVMQFLKEHHMGDRFPGIVTGVTNGGAFISIEKFLIEGMVKSADLPGSQGRSDHWILSEHTGRLTGQRSGGTIGIGDMVEVQIVNIDLATRQMDLTIDKLPDHTTSPSVGRGRVKKGPADNAKGPVKRGDKGKRPATKSSAKKKRR